MDKKLEERLREAIDAQDEGPNVVVIDIKDAKRLLYRLKKENAQPLTLEYRKDKK